MHTLINTINTQDREIKFDLFFNKYSTIIFSLIYKSARTYNIKLKKSDAEDIFQEIAIKIIKNRYLEKYDEKRSSITTWLAVICKTSVIDYCRKLFRIQSSETSEDALCRVKVKGKEPFLLPNGVLTKRQTEVINFIFKDGLEANDIAEWLDISPSTVRAIKFQALERLRNHFLENEEHTRKTPARRQAS